MSTFYPYLLLALSFRFSLGKGRGFACTMSAIGIRLARLLPNLLDKCILFVSRKKLPAIDELLAKMDPCKVFKPFPFKNLKIKKKKSTTLSVNIFLIVIIVIIF